MCTVPLPPGVYPFAVDKYIHININNHSRKVKSYYSEWVVKSERVNLVICVSNAYVILSITLYTYTYKPLKAELCDKLCIPSKLSGILWY